MPATGVLAAWWHAYNLEEWVDPRPAQTELHSQFGSMHIQQQWHWVTQLARLARQRTCRRTLDWKPSGDKCCSCALLWACCGKRTWRWVVLGSVCVPLMCWAAGLAPMEVLPKQFYSNSSKISGFTRIKVWPIFVEGENGVNHIRGQLCMPTNRLLILEAHTRSLLSLSQLILQKLKKSNATNWG